MVELHQRRVLKHITPPQVRLVWNVAVERIEELLLWWCEAKTHVGELVIDETGIETSNQGTRHGRGEDEEGKAHSGPLKNT